MYSVFILNEKAARETNQRQKGDEMDALANQTAQCFHLLIMFWSNILLTLFHQKICHGFAMIMGIA
jgi:hypothetical protein